MFSFEKENEKNHADCVIKNCNIFCGIDTYYLLLLQSFIDKFRYNAKRASLVQSRIKVKFNINCHTL